MKPLAWIEIVDRHGDVTSRYPVHAYPVRVGRAYSCDVVLDDPYVAANHLEINSVEDGGFQIKDLESRNGMTIDTLRGRQTDAIISADNVVRIGHTQLRIRPASFAVAVEKHLPESTWHRRWTALFVAVPFLLLAYFISLWAEYDSAESYSLLLRPMLIGLPFVLMWVIFWSFVRRTHSVVNFTAHAVITCFGLGALLLLDEPLVDYIGFAFNSGMISDILSVVGEPLVIGIMLYHHVRLGSRSSPRKVGMVVAMLTIACTGILVVNEKLSDENDFVNLHFSSTVAPPSLLMVKGEGAEAFIAGASRLKSKVDE